MKIKLWLDNKVAGEYEAELADLAREFAGSDYNRGDYLDWPPARRCGTWLACDKTSTLDPGGVDLILDEWGKLPGDERYPNGLGD